jgi:hypothetical protein
VNLDDALSLLDSSDAESSNTASNLDSVKTEAIAVLLVVLRSTIVSKQSELLSTPAHVEKQWPNFIELEGARIIDVKHLSGQLDNGCFLCGSGLPRGLRLAN